MRESPRWGLIKRLHEIMAEESHIQDDTELCTANHPLPCPQCQVLLITNSFLLMLVRLNMPRKHEALHSLRTRIFRLCKSLNPKMDLISPIHIINIMLQGHTCAGTCLIFGSVPPNQKAARASDHIRKHPLGLEAFLTCPQPSPGLPGPLSSLSCDLSRAGQWLGHNPGPPAPP